MTDVNIGFIDYTYINRISHSLKLFKKLSPSTFVCRCPICGDSKKSEYKTRFYFIKKNGKWSTYCHNCHWSSGFGYFLKNEFPTLYSEYRTDIFKDKIKPPKAVAENKIDLKQQLKDSFVIPEIRDTFDYTLSHFIRFTDMPKSHPARQYVTNRGILKEDIYYVKNFGKMIKRMDENIKYDMYYNQREPRLIIPFWNQDGDSLIFQARAFGKEYLRYITIKKREDAPKIFGLNKADFSETIYIVEGPIDSFFLENCLAMGGASYPDIPEAKEYVFVYDNEPRNTDILRRMETIISKGHRIFCPPDGWDYKDLNEAWMAGESKENIQKVIDDNSWCGLIAKTKLAKFKKS